MNMQLMIITVRTLGKGESSKNSLTYTTKKKYTVFLFLLLNILLQKSIKGKVNSSCTKWHHLC